MRHCQSRRNLDLLTWIRLWYRTIYTQIQLLTGRTHQIRVQMAALGCPVLGDDKYGDREANKRYRQKRQLLLAKRLTVAGKTFESTRELTIQEIIKEDL